MRDPRTSKPTADYDIDRVIRRALQEQAERIPVPDPEESLAEVFQRFAAARRRRLYRRWAGAGASAALLLLLVWNPTGYSWNPWLMVRQYFISEEGTGLVQMGRQVRPERALTPPPPGPGPGYQAVSPADLAPPSAEEGVAALGGAETPVGAGAAGGANSAADADGQPQARVIELPPRETLTLEEAAQRAPFTLRSPAWLPEDTEVLRVFYRATTPTGTIADVRIQFGGPLGKDLELAQNGPIEQFGSGHGFDPETTRVSDVDINGAPAVLLEFLVNDTSSLEWFTDGVHYRMRSDWDGETTVRIARSLEPVGGEESP